MLPNCYPKKYHKYHSLLLYIFLSHTRTICITYPYPYRILITHQYHLRIHRRLSTILKTSNKNVWSSVFWYVKVYMFWKFIQYTIHWDKIQRLKKFPSDKINVTKMHSFLFCELQLITVLLLICNSYMSWNTRFVSLKLCVWFSIFHSVSFLLKIIFLFN